MVGHPVLGQTDSHGVPLAFSPTPPPHPYLPSPACCLWTYLSDIAWRVPRLCGSDILPGWDRQHFTALPFACAFCCFLPPSRVRHAIPLLPHLRRDFTFAACTLYNRTGLTFWHGRHPSAHGWLKMFFPTRWVGTGGGPAGQAGVTAYLLPSLTFSGRFFPFLWDGVYSFLPVGRPSPAIVGGAFGTLSWFDLPLPPTLPVPPAARCPLLVHSTWHFSPHLPRCLPFPCALQLTLFTPPYTTIPLCGTLSFYKYIKGKKHLQHFIDG